MMYKFLLAITIIVIFAINYVPVIQSEPLIINSDNGSWIDKALDTESHQTIYLNNKIKVDIEPNAMGFFVSNEELKVLDDIIKYIKTKTNQIKQGRTSTVYLSNTELYLVSIKDFMNGKVVVIIKQKRKGV